MPPLIIVGAGQAAAQLVASLAQDGYSGPVTLLGDEPHLPYQRPPLSKKYLAGELALDRLYVKPAAFYEKAGVDLRLGTRVERIDRPGKAVILADGTALPYSTLVLATGSRPRRLALPGSELDGVFYLRTVADVDAIRGRFADARSLVVVGGGYIGLELAAVATKHGLQVTVLEQVPRLMARGVGPVVSAFYESLHRSEGVRLVTGAKVLGFEGKDRVTAVVAEDGVHPADLVVVGVGALPNVELAAAAGLTVENGIVVDAECRTDDPAIYAIGDCTKQVHALTGQPLRLESVHNALEQGRVAAAAICGRPPPTLQVPWFWSDQYDVKLQMVGLSQGHDQAVVRGDPGSGRSFAVFYLREGQLIAVDAVNRAPEFMLSKQLIADRARPDPAKLADERVAVKDLRS
ncbi:MAG: FAD-dependent oxidoreductase [Alphaproteobacteria bacterium]|nr:FAD-dependent oxidoreductase [Alphaproteobacteria bacterium]